MAAKSITRIIHLIPGNEDKIEERRSEALSREEFCSRYVCKQVPVIVRGAVSNWPAFQKWPQVGYLESLVSDQVVSYTRTFNAHPNILFGRYCKKSAKLIDCIREMRSLPDDATYSIAAVGVPPEWEKDLGAYSCLSPSLDLPPMAYGRRRLFIYKNAASDWHYHPLDETMTTQLAGSKKISLFKPKPTEWERYSNIIDRNLHHLACAEVLFSADEMVTKYEGTLFAGDVAYIPPNWWHGIEPPDPEMGITLAYCFRSPPDV